MLGDVSHGRTPRDHLSLVNLKPSLADGVPQDAFLAVRTGSVVCVELSGNLGAKGGAWDNPTLATGLPRPMTSSSFAPIIVQGQSSPCLMWVDWTGTAKVRGFGATSFPGGWCFATLAYITSD